MSATMEPWQVVHHEPPPQPAQRPPQDDSGVHALTSIGAAHNAAQSALAAHSAAQTAEQHRAHVDQQKQEIDTHHEVSRQMLETAMGLAQKQEQMQAQMQQMAQVMAAMAQAIQNLAQQHAAPRKVTVTKRDGNGGIMEAVSGPHVPQGKL